MGYEYYSGNRYAILKAEPCDPNILGLISDFVLEVDSVDICIVYTTLKFGIKFSVRSCEKAVNANELAAYLASGIGSGGGRKGKAGGMLDFKLIAQSDEYYRNATEDQRFYLAADILRKRMDCYFHSYDVIYAGKKPYDTSDMDLYEKKEIEVGYVKATDVVKSGTLLTVRFGKVIKNEEFGFTDSDSHEEVTKASEKIMEEITALWEEENCKE